MHHKPVEFSECKLVYWKKKEKTLCTR